MSVSHTRFLDIHYSVSNKCDFEILVRGHNRSLKMPPVDRPHTTYYYYYYYYYTIYMHL